MSVKTSLPLIYLASPYSHPIADEKYHREYVVTVIAAKLTKKYGYPMFLPITQSAAMARVCAYFESDFKQWASIDLSAITHCDELWVVTMSGWDTSVGVTAEIKHAMRLNIPIYFIDHRTLRKTKYRPNHG